jgi:hypothetical protein
VSDRAKRISGRSAALPPFFATAVFGQEPTKRGVSLRRVRPVPRVGEGVELRLARFAKEDVVIGVGVERRGEIKEIDAGVGKKLGVAQPREVVAEQERFMRAEWGGEPSRAGNYRCTSSTVLPGRRRR